MTKTFAIVTLVAGSLFAGSLALQAEDAPKTPSAGGGAHARPNLDQVTKDLGLTDDQKAKVKAALEEQQTAMKALAPEDRRTTKGKEIREAFTAKLKTILTPEQFEKWQKNRPQGGKPGAGGGGDKSKAPATQ